MTQLALKTRATCRNCRPGPETFWYMRQRYLFDVDEARRIVNTDHREPLEIDDSSVRFSVETSEINEQHLEHVDTRHPGIIAHIRYPQNDQDWVRGHLLIDGHHRAAVCLERGQPFFAYLLTEEESERILLKSPARRCSP